MSRGFLPVLVLLLIPVLYVGCANSGGIGVAKPSEKEVAYVAKLEPRVRRHLSVPAELTKDELATTLSFRVDTSGNVRDFFVELSSGNSKFDALARQAVEKAAPLPPLPTDMVTEGHSARVRATFRSR